MTFYELYSQDNFICFSCSGQSATNVAIELKIPSGTFLYPLNNNNNDNYSQLLAFVEQQNRQRHTPSGPVKVPRTDRLMRFELVLPFAGVFRFADTLALDNGFVIGTRLGYQLIHQLTIEAEGGVTFAKSNAGQSGKVFQTMANLRYNINLLGSTRWVPYVTAGGGYVFFREFNVDDEAYAIQGGLGATMNLSNSIGVRIDARYFYFDQLMNTSYTNNFQATGGLVFKF